MARRTRTARTTRSKGAPEITTREAPATTTARRTRTADVEVVEEESSGMDVDAGIVLSTTLLLVAAILCVDAILGRAGGGVFF